MPYKDKEAQRKFQQEWRLARRAKLAELKDIPCTDCGIKYPYYVMDFDHRGEDKTGRIATMVIHNTWESVIEEIDKCDVVCANCHRERTHAKQQYIARKWR